MPPAQRNRGARGRPPRAAGHLLRASGSALSAGGAGAWIERDQRQRASKVETGGKCVFTNFLALMSSFSLTVLPVSSSSSKGL